MREGAVRGDAARTLADTTTCCPCCRGAAPGGGSKHQEQLRQPPPRNATPVRAGHCRAGRRAEKGFYRVQGGALRDERQAQAIASAWRRTAASPVKPIRRGQSISIAFGWDGYPLARRPRADTQRPVDVGATGGFVVNEGGASPEPAMRPNPGATSTVYPGRWLAVAPVWRPERAGAG